MKVLIAESNPQQRDVIDNLCLKLQYDTTLVDSVEAALDACRSRTFDLICTAHYLADATGFDLCRQIRQLDTIEACPIVLITKDTHHTFVEKAFSTGISETFDLSQLEELEIYFGRIGEHYQPLAGDVLLVEDSPSQQQVIAKLLTDSGLTVSCCSNVDDAWKYFNGHEYDLIITDIVLEGSASGLHLVNKVRRISNEQGVTPIIVMSAYNDEKRRVELFRLGADEYISKPIIHEELIARARRLIKSSQLNREVQRNHRAMSQFLGRMSHECRNSINVISGISRLMLRKGQLDERQQQQLAMIDSAATHQLSLVNDILDYSKLQAHEIAAEYTPCELPSLLTEIINLFHYKADELNIELALELPGNLPANLPLDERKIKQVLLNLVGNAVKFTQQGGVYLSASLDNHKHLCLSVRDTGPGIADDDIALLFQAFRQTQLGKQERGTGLGLAICAELAHLMGGEMNVSSEIGTGSIFSLNIPVGPPA